MSTPADYPANDIARFVWPDWRDTPSVYGPVFVWLAAVITALFRGLGDVIEAFRAVAVAASLGSLWYVVKLVGRVRPQRTAYAAVMIGLNPVVLFHTVGGGHVDVLVMLAVSAAVYLVAAGATGDGRADPRRAREDLRCGAARAADRVRRHAGRAVEALAGAGRPHRHRGSIAFVAAVPFMQASNPTLGMVELVQHGSWIAPPALVERVFETVGTAVGGELGGSAGIVIAGSGCSQRSRRSWSPSCDR